MTTSLCERLRAALPTAMKSRDGAAVTALRSAIAAVENAAAVAPPASNPGLPALGLPTPGVGTTEVERRAVDDAEAERIVRAEVTDRLDAAEEYDRHGRTDHAARLRAEAAALTTVLDGPT